MHKIYRDIQAFISGNLIKIFILLSAMVFLGFFEKFPYLNTFLSFPYPWNSFLLLFILSVILFKLNEVHSFSIALFLIGVAVILCIFGKETVAQSVGVIVYYLLWFGLIQMIVGCWHETKHT